MTTQPPPRDHLAGTILERAAAHLAEHGAATMSDIAQAAGVGRATLYRHFTTRDALLQAMADTAVDDLGDRLAEAGLGQAPVREAVARACRAFIATGGKYIALTRTGHKPTDAEAVEQRVLTPLRALIERGVTEGALRSDIAPESMLAVLSAVVETGLELAARIGAEQAAATITTLFLDGTTQPDDAHRGNHFRR